MFEERTQQFLPGLSLSQGPADGLRQSPRVLRDVICQIDVFRAVPHLLIGIEFGGISRQPFDMQSSRESLNQFNAGTAVHRPSVPHQNDTSGKMLKQTGHEHLGIDGADVVVEYLKVKSQPSGYCRDSNRRYGREPLASVPGVLNRSSTLWRPGSSDCWLQHKAAFVGKNDGFSRPSGVFLYRARRSFAKSLSHVHRVRGLDVLVSDSSNPSVQERARRRKGRNLRRKFVVSIPQSEAESINRWQTHVGSVPATKVFPAASTAERSVSVLGRGGFWPLTPLGRPDGELLPIDRPLRVLRRVVLPPRIVKTSVPAALWLLADAAPHPCVKVLSPYRMLSAKTCCISNLFKSQ
jgi:hypothetical protein